MKLLNYHEKTEEQEPEAEVFLRLEGDDGYYTVILVDQDGKYIKGGHLLQVFVEEASHLVVFRRVGFVGSRYVRLNDEGVIAEVD